VLYPDSWNIERLTYYYIRYSSKIKLTFFMEEYSRIESGAFLLSVSSSVVKKKEAST